MRNNINFFIIVIIFIFFTNLSIGDEVQFESNKLEILEKGNLIKAQGNVKAVTDDGLVITGNKSEYNKKKSILTITGNFKAVTVDGLVVTGNKSEYNKKKSILTITGNVFANDKKGNNQIVSNQIIYNKNKKTIFTKGETKSKIKDKYEITGREIFHDRKNMIFSSKDVSILKDNFGNVIETEEFKFSINEDLIESKNLKLKDQFGHNYQFKNVYVNLKTNEVIAKDVDIDFENSLFENENNEPRLKGKSVVSNLNETTVYKAAFTTCKKNKKKKCPSWSIYADEAHHNKKKQILKYKNAWLKIFDKPVLYFPRFFHPDPTVERQSGFLAPNLLNSSFSGQSLQIPYYKVFSESKDLTVSPRVFFDNNLILQTEYRQANKNSDAIFDMSFNKGNNKSRSHLFANIIGSINDNNYEINLQKVNNDEYLKLYEIKSPIIRDVSTLNSYLKFENNSKNYLFDASVEVFEDLSKINSDRFEYIYPNYNFSKNLGNLNSFDGNFNFVSTGFQKKYNTNVYEGRIINDLSYNSGSFIKNGLLNRFDFLIKNVNTNSKKSPNYSDHTENKLLSTIMFESRYPLFKEDNNYNKNLTPIISARYSPTQTKDLTDLDRRIDYTNIFSINRIGESDSVEGGGSLTFGIEYFENSKDNNELLSVSLANVIRNNKNDDMPAKTTLGKKYSDIFGKIKFKPSKYLNFKYDFQIDNDFDAINYNLLEAGLTINNFVTSFEYLEEDNFIGNKSYITNKTTYSFNKENSISINSAKNLDKGISEYYNLIYEYQNDCLAAAIEYNKTFYSDGDLKPQKNIFLMIKILPFGDLVSQPTPLN